MGDVETDENEKTVLRIDCQFQYQQKGVKIQKGVSPFLRRSFFDVQEVTSKDHFI
jgi:hypothetical protein